MRGWEDEKAAPVVAFSGVCLQMQLKPTLTKLRESLGSSPAWRSRNHRTWEWRHTVIWWFSQKWKLRKGESTDIQGSATAPTGARPARHEAAIYCCLITSCCKQQRGGGLSVTLDKALALLPFCLSPSEGSVVPHRASEKTEPNNVIGSRVTSAVQWKILRSHCFP